MSAADVDGVPGGTFSLPQQEESTDLRRRIDAAPAAAAIIDF